jgi:hypothetical protein
VVGSDSGTVVSAIIRNSSSRSAALCAIVCRSLNDSAFSQRLRRFIDEGGGPTGGGGGGPARNAARTLVTSVCCSELDGDTIDRELIDSVLFSIDDDDGGGVGERRRRDSSLSRL